MRISNKEIEDIKKAKQRVYDLKVDLMFAEADLTRTKVIILNRRNKSYLEYEIDRHTNHIRKKKQRKSGKEINDNTIPPQRIPTIWTGS